MHYATRKHAENSQPQAATGKAKISKVQTAPLKVKSRPVPRLFPISTKPPIYARWATRLKPNSSRHPPETAHHSFSEHETSTHSHTVRKRWYSNENSMSEFFQKPLGTPFTGRTRGTAAPLWMGGDTLPAPYAVVFISPSMCKGARADAKEVEENRPHAPVAVAVIDRASGVGRD